MADRAGEAPLGARPIPGMPDTPHQESTVDDEDRYALLRSIRKERGAKAFVESISQQLLLQHDANWGDLLGAAPQALCFLGQCFVATTSSTAIASLQLPPESNLEERALRANLLHCSDLGRMAFSDAQTKMDKVHMVTTYICEPRGPIDKVLRLLDDEELAKVDLQRQLDKLKRYSQDCVRDSEVKEKFAIWQDYATRIRKACTAAEDQVENEKTKVQEKMVVAEIRTTHQEVETKRTEQETANFRTHVDVHQAGYQKAQKEVPTGWNLIAQDAATKLINIWPDLISMARVGRPWAMFAARVQSSDEPEASSATLQTGPTIPNPHDDYGFHVSKQISTQIHSLNKKLHHGLSEPPEYGVDWYSLYAFDSSTRLGGTPEGSIDVALGLFRQARSQAPPRHGQQESASSREVTDVLDIIIDVCEEIYSSKEAQRSLANASQPKDKGMVQRWKETVNSACSRIDILEKQLASAETEYTDHIQNLKDSGSKRKKTKQGMKGILNKNNVQIARENYLAAQKALADSEKLLAERIEREAQAKVKFNEVQLELAKLKSENMNMDKIKNILKKCIDNLTNFLEHLDKLVIFFTSLYNFVDVIHDGPAKEFLAQVNNMVQISGALANGDLEQRRVRMKYLKDDLLVDTLKLKGSYLVAGELASVYVDISKKHIMKGVNAVERLGLRTEENCNMSPAERSGQLLMFARKAQSAISTQAEERRKKLRDELYIHDREIQEIGIMVEQAQLENGEGSEYENEWDEE